VQYINRREHREKPTVHISYDEGLHLIRTFLKYASHHTVEDLQAFTGQWVPSPSWVRTENVIIPQDHISKAAGAIVSQLGPAGVQEVGGTEWWKWRQKGGDLKGEWIEMRAHYNEQKRQNAKSRRIMLYVHGGGYFFGSVDEHRYQMQRHARKLKARVFAPRYRLSPQFPFPCGLLDCVAAYLYLLSLHDPTEVIFAGDSAGGGMVVAMLCLLRDQSIPLPAGAILISPWVDLTHSFPSLGGNADLDYIPPYGFMQKPSVSWPPPNQAELKSISKLAENIKSPKADSSVAARDNGKGQPSPQMPLSIELDGKLVVLEDQIQMYATNQLLAHPLVSPVLQPSLGGLPPVLILTGGGEILRDEQIYLAHKMANPSKYHLGATYRMKYDPDDKMLRKYKPTPVQLQVWEDLCHVAPTLSFTRPAKFMYRSIAQFGAWVLAKAQQRAIEIVDDDDISVISSQSDSESATEAELDSSLDSIARTKADTSKTTGNVGRAGDPIPPFQNHMIRQRIDRNGKIYPLTEEHELPALQMHPGEVGVIKEGPVRKWLEAKHHWDTKYASTRRRVQKERAKTLASGKITGFEADEYPPPSALAGRRTDKDILLKKKRKSYGLAMWSGWGSRHDESTLKREEHAVEAEKSHEQPASESNRSGEPETSQQPLEADLEHDRSHTSPTTRRRNRDRSFSSKRQTSESGVRGRRRTISVTDRGQAEGKFVPAVIPHHDGPTSTLHESPAILTSPALEVERATSPNPSVISAGYLPKFRTGSHLRDDSTGEPRTPVVTDAASVMTGRTGVVADDASTRAVFAASGVSKAVDVAEQQPGRAKALSVTSRPQSPLASEAMSLASNGDDSASIAPSAMSRTYAPLTGMGSDTPRSHRSLDRLQSHQLDDGMGRLAALRNPSSTAVMRAPGVVDAVGGFDDSAAGTHTVGFDAGERASELDLSNPPASGAGSVETQHAPADIPDPKETKPDRPEMYPRSGTDFQTAVEDIS
jgi:acetyl esterase/lipase